MLATISNPNFLTFIREDLTLTMHNIRCALSSLGSSDQTTAQMSRIIVPPRHLPHQPQFSLITQTVQHAVAWLRSRMRAEERERASNAEANGDRLHWFVKERTNEFTQISNPNHSDRMSCPVNIFIAMEHIACGYRLCVVSV